MVLLLFLFVVSWKRKNCDGLAERKKGLGGGGGGGGRKGGLGGWSFFYIFVISVVWNFPQKIF